MPAPQPAPGSARVFSAGARLQLHNQIPSALKSWQSHDQSLQFTYLWSRTLLTSPSIANTDKVLEPP